MFYAGLYVWYVTAVMVAAVFQPLKERVHHD